MLVSQPWVSAMVPRSMQNSVVGSYMAKSRRQTNTQTWRQESYMPGMSVLVQVPVAQGSKPK